MILLNYLIISGLISSLYVHIKYERMKRGRPIYDMFSKRAIVVIAFIFGFYLFPVGLFIYGKAFALAFLGFVYEFISSFKGNILERRAHKRILKKYTIEYPDGPRCDLLKLSDVCLPHKAYRMYSFIEKTIQMNGEPIIYFVTDFKFIRGVNEVQYQCIDTDRWSLICKIILK